VHDVCTGRSRKIHRRQASASFLEATYGVRRAVAPESGWAARVGRPAQDCRCWDALSPTQRHAFSLHRHPQPGRPQPRVGTAADRGLLRRKVDGRHDGKCDHEHRHYASIPWSGISCSRCGRPPAHLPRIASRGSVFRLARLPLVSGRKSWGREFSTNKTARMVVVGAERI